MKNLFIILFVVIITGCSQKSLTPEEIIIIEKKVLNEICETSARDYFEYKNFNIKIDECSEYYKIIPDSINNYPVMINYNGDKITECKPKTKGDLQESAPECFEKCIGKNLCLGTEIKCSKENKDECLLENSIRMKDKTICEKIKNIDLKNNCLN